MFNFFSCHENLTIKKTSILLIKFYKLQIDILINLFKIMILYFYIIVNIFLRKLYIFVPFFIFKSYNLNEISYTIESMQIFRIEDTNGM